MYLLYHISYSFWFFQYFLTQNFSNFEQCDVIDSFYIYSSTEGHFPANHPNHCKIAYKIRTSGTTGLPKIVTVPHSSIVPNILDLRWENDSVSR